MRMKHIKREVKFQIRDLLRAQPGFQQGFVLAAERLQPQFVSEQSIMICVTV